MHACTHAPTHTMQRHASSATAQCRIEPHLGVSLGCCCYMWGVWKARAVMVQVVSILYIHVIVDRYFVTWHALFFWKYFSHNFNTPGSLYENDCDVVIIDISWLFTLNEQIAATKQRWNSKQHIHFNNSWWGNGSMCSCFNHMWWPMRSNTMHIEATC